jgi:regulation of enolase protein 1 (concanavalin A-like superfamily)
MAVRIFLAIASLLVCTFASAQTDKQMQTIQGWGTVIDPNGFCKISEDKGKVTIAIPKTHHSLTYTPQYTKLNAPRILQDVQGDFMVQVRVYAFPRPQANTSSSGRFSFVSCGLLLWQDEKNFLRCERAAEGDGGSLFAYFNRFQEGKEVANHLEQIADKDAILQVDRSGNKLTFAIKEGADEQSWKVIHREEVSFPQKLKVGVHATNTTLKEFSPQLQDFKLSKK